MIPRTPRAPRPDTLFPYTTLFLSASLRAMEIASPIPRVPPVTSATRAIERHSLLVGSTAARPVLAPGGHGSRVSRARSEEHTSELQSLMRISYAVFCLKKKKEGECKYHSSQNHRYYTYHREQ